MMSQLKTLNPANATPTRASDRKRIPMSVPVQKLAVPDIPGYHLHWFRTEPGRIERAQTAGYEFVTPEEVHVNSVGIGVDSATSGNTDMGSLVSIVAGKELEADGQPRRLVLMKLKLEYYNEDQAQIEEQNLRTAESIMGGSIGSANHDRSNRYVDQSRTQIPDLFKPKRPRVA